MPNLKIYNKTMSLKKLSIKALYNTPAVDFNPKNGNFFLNGKSIPENAIKFYEPLADWLKKYVPIAKEETNLHLNLEYFNTASAIWISKIIKILSQIDNMGRLLIIHIYFHVEELIEMEENDIKEAIAPATDALAEATVSIGVKIYGTDDAGQVVKEKLILF